MSDGIRRRISIDITEEQQEIMWKHFQHGEQKVVFGVLVSELCSLLEEHGRVIIGLIGANYMKTSEVFPSLNAAVEGAERLKGD